MNLGFVDAIKLRKHEQDVERYEARDRLSMLHARTSYHAALLDHHVTIDDKYGIALDDGTAAAFAEDSSPAHTVIRVCG